VLLLSIFLNKRNSSKPNRSYTTSVFPTPAASFPYAMIFASCCAKKVFEEPGMDSWRSVKISFSVREYADFAEGVVSRVRQTRFYADYIPSDLYMAWKKKVQRQLETQCLCKRRHTIVPKGKRKSRLTVQGTKVDSHVFLASRAALRANFSSSAFSFSSGVNAFLGWRGFEFLRNLAASS